jgi:hypothetical protein
MKLGPQIVILVSLAGLFAYCAYGTVTHSGIPAYLMALELSLTGWSEETLTMAVTFIVLCIPVTLAVVGILKLFPASMVWIDQPAGGRVGAPQPDLMRQLSKPVTNISWKVVGWVAASPLAVLAVLYPVLYLIDQHDQSEKIYPVDLSQGPAAVPKDAKFVRLTGVMARRYAVTYKSGTNGSEDTIELFTPIVENGWKPGSPSRYFVRYQTHAYGGPPSWPDVFRQRGAAQFTGKIVRSMPVFAESKFRSEGLKLDSQYVLIDWKDLPGEHIPHSDNANDAAIICVGLSALLAFFAMVAKWSVAMKVKAASRRRV